MSNDPYIPSPKQDNVGTVVVIVVAVVAGLGLLVCGGIIAGGVLMYRQLEQEMNFQQLTLQDQIQGEIAAIDGFQSVRRRRRLPASPR